MNTLEEIALTDYMQNALEESIKSCPSEQRGWYKTCTYDDYKDSLVEDIYDENDKIGEGINYISGRVVIDDDNIKELFEIARDRAYKECSEEE